MMLINHINSFANIYTSNVAPKPKTKKVNSFKDEMLLSNQAQTFKSMLKDLTALSDVRQNRVDELSQKISSGTYDVKAENIAAKLIANF